MDGDAMCDEETLGQVDANTPLNIEDEGVC